MATQTPSSGGTSPTGKDEAPGAPATDPNAQQPDPQDAPETPQTPDKPKPSPPAIDVAKLAESDAFALGVSAGDVTDSAVILWTHTLATDPLFVRVWKDGAPTTHAFAAPVTPSDGFAHVEATGLQADTVYRYAFTLNDSLRSIVGRFRTAPALDSQAAVTFAGSCCTHQRGAPYPALEHAAGRDDIQFFVHGGDQVYCDGAITQADYRAKYAGTYKESGMLALNAAHATFKVWDDHEVDNNFDPEKVNAAQFAAARAAFFEHTATRRNTADADRMWRSQRFGKTLELFVLDARSERKPSTRLGNDPIYLSRAQMDWLKAGLKASTAKFKCIVNSVPISTFGGLFQAAAGDRWEGFPKARTEILDHITNEAIAGVWWLSGDFHFGTASAKNREILWGPGGNRPNVLYPWIDMNVWEFSTGDSNYVVLTCDPVKNELGVTFVDTKGDTIFQATYPNS